MAWHAVVPSRAVAGTLLIALAACGDVPEAVPEALAGPGDPDPPTAQWAMVEGLRAGRDAQRHPSDGGGRAWLEDPQPGQVGQPGRWTIVYEAGEEGVAVGGMIFLQPSPFWGWSTPQPYRDNVPGYTTVSTDAEGVQLEAQVAGRGGETLPLAVVVGGRPLRAGEQVRFVYGSGSLGARPDRFVESASPFWISVDGDGDGVREVVADPPTVAVRPGPPARLVLLAPSTVRSGQTLRLAVSVLDAAGNAGCEVEGEVHVRIPDGMEAAGFVRLLPGSLGRAILQVEAHTPGVYRLEAEGPEGLTATSNPIEVSTDRLPILWGDLHGHSGLSDGTGTPEDYYTYARDVAALDVAVLTDHDHWGMRTLDLHPDLLERIESATRRFHEPGRFVTLHGYEWTNWIHGHRHVLFFDDKLRVYSSLDEAYETPRQLWDALAGQPALTLAHHSAGGPIATNWTYRPDEVLEPVTEIVSVHGSSEAPDSPLPIYNPVTGNFVRDALDLGYHLGFVGSGDSHDGHPGLAHLASPGGSGGLVAMFASDRTRKAVLAALRARHTYATSGPRILLRASCQGAQMGESLPQAASSELRLEVHGTGVLERVDVIRSGTVVETAAGFEGPDATLTWQLANLREGEYFYVRVVQADGSAAWSSPFFVE